MRQTQIFGFSRGQPALSLAVAFGKGWPSEAERVSSGGTRAARHAVVR
jgi:hypothetical protein